MAIKVDSVMKKDFVTLLSDVDIEYVSHVQFGANKIPYRLLKGEVTASDVAKEIIAQLKALVDEELKISSDPVASVQAHHGDLPGDTAAPAVEKLNQSLTDQHSALLNLKDQLAKINPADLDNVSDDHLDELKHVLLQIHEHQATVKYDDSQPRDDNGRWTSEGGNSSTSLATTSGSKPSAADHAHEKVNRAVQAFHDHAVVIGQVAPKVSTMASIASTALTVVAPFIPHPAIKAGVVVAAKAAAGVAAVSEAVAIAAHEAERELKPHLDDTKKSETGEGDMSLEVIHSIIQPSGRDIMTLQKQYPEWFKNVKLSEKVDQDGKISFVQKSDAAFDDSAFRFVDAGYGLEFKVGKLKRTEKSDDILYIPTQINSTKADVTGADPITDTGATANLNPDPMDTTVVEKPADTPTSTFFATPDMLSIPEGPEKFSFRDMFRMKLDAFNSGVVAAMELSEDPVTRRKSIMTFWKLFGDFLNAALDKVDANISKTENTETDTNTPITTGKNSTEQQNDTGGFDMAELFTTKDEMKAFIVDTVKSTLKEEQSAAPTEPEKKTEKSESDVDQVAELNKKLEGISEQFNTTMASFKSEFDALTQKTESLVHGTGPRKSWSEDVQSQTVTQKGESHIMAGVFTNL